MSYQSDQDYSSLHQEISTLQTKVFKRIQKEQGLTPVNKEPTSLERVAVHLTRCLIELEKQ